MIVLALLVSGAITAVESWFAMLLIGAIHSEVPAVPAFSYWGAFWLVTLVNLLVGLAVTLPELTAP